MSESVVEQLIIKLGVDSKGVDSGIQNAVKKASFSLKSALTSFVAPVLGALMSGQFIKNTYEEVINLDHLSTSLGVNVERLQMWQGAAKDAGSSAEAVGVMWQRMNAMITDFSVNGTGTLKELAEKGVVPALTTIDGKVKDTDTYLLELADTLHNMDAQAASGIGRKLGIRDFNLMNFLQQGSGEINQQLKHIKDLGVYTMRDVEIARDFDVALNDVTRVMKMSLVPIFRIVTPLISKLGNGLVYLSQHTRAFIPAIVGLAGVITAMLLPSIKELGKSIFMLLTNPVFLKAALIIGVLAAIGLAIEDILVWMEGGESVIGEFFGPYETFGKRVEDTLKELMDVLTELLHVIVDPFMEGVKAIAEFAETVQNKIQEVIDTFNQLPDAITQGAKNAADRFREWFVKPVTEMLDTLINKIKNLFNFGGRISSLNASAGKLSVSGGGGNFDNSRHSTDISNNVDIHVDSKQDAVDISRGIMANPVPAFNPAYGGTP